MSQQKMERKITQRKYWGGGGICASIFRAQATSHKGAKHHYGLIPPIPLYHSNPTAEPPPTPEPQTARHPMPREHVTVISLVYTS